MVMSTLDLKSKKKIHCEERDEIRVSGKLDKKEELNNFVNNFVND